MTTEQLTLNDCPVCGNAYLAVRTDLYKDGREFVYCDCCGCLADRRVWNRIAALEVAQSQPVAVELPVVGWQPIETAPKDGTRILVWPFYGKVECDQWNPTDENWLPGVTHWMPLPSAPNAQSAHQELMVVTGTGS